MWGRGVISHGGLISDVYSVLCFQERPIQWKQWLGNDFKCIIWEQWLSYLEIWIKKIRCSRLYITKILYNFLWYLNIGTLWYQHKAILLGASYAPSHSWASYLACCLHKIASFISCLFISLYCLLGALPCEMMRMLMLIFDTSAICSTWSHQNKLIRTWVWQEKTL